MTKEEIFDKYAIEQGYESWVDLFQKCEVYIEIMIHVDNVTDLIQEELKKKIADNFGNEETQQEILNTEIL